jgi:hypothetical protein
MYIGDLTFESSISPDNKDFNGSIPTARQSIREETWMKREDEPFFEDDNNEDEEDLSFPDEDVEDEDYEEVEIVKEDKGTFPDYYEIKASGPWFSRFLSEPWPGVVFILTIIGLGVVLITPPAVWAIWNYFILADYFLIVLVGVAIIFSMVTWTKARGHRLRWAGPTNIIVALLCGVIGTLDSISWMLSGTGLFVGLDTPVISLCMVMTVFSLYTLWLVQRSFGPQQP